MKLDLNNNIFWQVFLTKYWLTTPTCFAVCIAMRPVYNTEHNHAVDANVMRRVSTVVLRTNYLGHPRRKSTSQWFYRWFSG